MKGYQVLFTAREKAECVTIDVCDEVIQNRVLVRSDYDLISAGTELANYHGKPNTGADGGYPVQVGYTVSGHVLQVGPDVKSLKVGDKVGMHWCLHRSHVLTTEDELLKVPDGVDMKDAAFMHLSSFPMLAIRKLELQLGESVMVAGLGLLGMMAVQYAKLSGAYPILACDFSQERRELALKLGADFAFDPRESDFIQKVMRVTDNKGVNAVVEVTGYISGLKQALEYVAWEGRIALLGCTRVSDECIDFYKYVHRRGIKIIGAHTNTRPKYESKFGEWTEFDDYRTFFKLLQFRNLQVKPLVSKIVSPLDAEQVYAELGGCANPPLGWLFDWSSVPDCKG